MKLHATNTPSPTRQALRGAAVLALFALSAVSASSLRGLTGTAADEINEVSAEQVLEPLVLQQQQQPEGEQVIGTRLSSAVLFRPSEDTEVQVSLYPALRKEENDAEVEAYYHKLALEEGIDLNDYNVTWAPEDLATMDHRVLGGISVSAAESNNARFAVYERSRRGIPGLSWSVDCIQQAQQWAQYLASSNQLYHRPDLSSGIANPWRVISENLAENVDVGYGGAHTALMNSEGHRANILDGRVNRLGIGIGRSSQGFYFEVQVFKQAV